MSFVNWMPRTAARLRRRACFFVILANSFRCSACPCSHHHKRGLPRSVPAALRSTRPVLSVSLAYLVPLPLHHPLSRAFSATLSSLHRGVLRARVGRTQRVRADGAHWAKDWAKGFGGTEARRQGAQCRAAVRASLATCSWFWNAAAACPPGASAAASGFSSPPPVPFAAAPFVASPFAAPPFAASPFVAAATARRALGDWGRSEGASGGTGVR